MLFYAFFGAFLDIFLINLQKGIITQFIIIIISQRSDFCNNLAQFSLEFLRLKRPLLLTFFALRDIISTRKELLISTEEISL